MNAALPRLRRITGEYRGGRRRQDPAGRSLRHRPAIASPASCWSATPSRPPARPPAPAPTRCSPTSSGSATSISRPGWRPKAWATTRSRRSTTIRSRRPATPGRWRRPISFRSLSIDSGIYWRAQRWARFLAWLGEGALRRLREGDQRGIKAAALTPPRRHPHRHRLHCHHRPDRPRYAACGSGRPRACDRRRWRRATARASRVRSPCRPISR